MVAMTVIFSWLSSYCNCYNRWTYLYIFVIVNGIVATIWIQSFDGFMVICSWLNQRVIFSLCLSCKNGYNPCDITSYYCNFGYTLNNYCSLFLVIVVLLTLVSSLISLCYLILVCNLLCYCCTFIFFDYDLTFTHCYISLNPFGASINGHVVFKEAENLQFYCLH